MKQISTISISMPDADFKHDLVTFSLVFLLSLQYTFQLIYDIVVYNVRKSEKA